MACPSLFLLASLLLCSPSLSTAQTSSPEDRALAAIAAATPRWSDLSLAQQESLMPLAPIWSSLDQSQKYKWITLAQKYPQLSSAEKNKLHERMLAWAALTPQQRALARFHFSTSKKLDHANRSANWDAYQALSPEERQRLAKRAAKNKPQGAAAAIGKKATQAANANTPLPAAPRRLQPSTTPIHPQTLLPLRKQPPTQP